MNDTSLDVLAAQINRHFEFLAHAGPHMMTIESRWAICRSRRVTALKMESDTTGSRRMSNILSETARRRWL